MRKTIILILILTGCLTAASADVFTFGVLNGTFTGTGSPLPAGVINVAQLTSNSVQFQITMNHYAANAAGNTTGHEIQYMIGVGGFEFNLADTTHLSISSLSATNGAGNTSFGSTLVLHTGTGNYDGFGALDVNIATTNNGNNLANSAVTFNFTLSRSVGTLAISDFQAMTSSNCGGNANSIVNTPCTFVAHINEWSPDGGGGNIRTGFGGTADHLITTPEPGSLALLGSGLLGIGGFVRRKLMKR